MKLVINFDIVKSSIYSRMLNDSYKEIIINIHDINVSTLSNCYFVKKQETAPQASQEVEK